MFYSFIFHLAKMTSCNRMGLRLAGEARICWQPAEHNSDMRDSHEYIKQISKCLVSQGRVAGALDWKEPG